MADRFLTPSEMKQALVLAASGQTVFEAPKPGLDSDSTVREELPRREPVRQPAQPVQEKPKPQPQVKKPEPPKKDIIKDILELKKYCYDNNLKDKFIRILKLNNQEVYLNKEYFTTNLLYKKKEKLDKIREDILEKVIY